MTTPSHPLHPIPPSRPDRSSVPGSGCEVFGQAAALRVDRELGPAEAAALEAHLEVCGACRTRAARSEALSALLRRWDAERAGRIEPPARLRLAIRSAVAEEGRRRRDEWRAVRFVKLATAAAVLLTLGAATAMGFAVSRVGPTTERAAGVRGTGRPILEAPASAWDPSSSAAASGVPQRDGPTFALLVPDEQVPAPAELDASSLRPSTWLGAEERARAVETLAFYEARRREREVFEMVCGEPAVWWRAPGTGTPHLITITALDHLISLGFTSVEDYASDPSRHRTMPADSDPFSSSSEAAVVVDTGRRLSDYFALPATPRGREALLRTPLANLRDGIRVFAIPAHGVPRAGGALPAPLGLAEAVVAGTVTLGEGAGDDLVAVVRGATRPIFIPAGELLDGGRVHRMTVRPVWIEPNRAGGESRIVVPCIAVATEHGSEGSAPVPTGLLAPPVVRRLLAEGGDVRRVQTWLKGHLPYLGGGDYSLVTSYPPQLTEGMALLEDALRRDQARGVVVVDASGNLLGVEVTELPVAAAATLLTRVVLSYSAGDYIEDYVRSVEPKAPHWRNPEPPAAGVALARLTEDVRTLTALERSAPAEGARNLDPIRRLRTVLPGARTAFEIVERPSDGAVVHASGVTR